MSRPHELRKRVAALRAWCEQRIHQCRRDEANLGPRSPTTYEAVTERRALSQVLERLGFTVPPRDEEDLRYRGTAAAAEPWPKQRGRRCD